MNTYHVQSIEEMAIIVALAEKAGLQVAGTHTIEQFYEGFPHVARDGDKLNGWELGDGGQLTQAELIASFFGIEKKPEATPELPSMIGGFAASIRGGLLVVGCQKISKNQISQLLMALTGQGPDVSYSPKYGTEWDAAVDVLELAGFEVEKIRILGKHRHQVIGIAEGKATSWPRADKEPTVNNLQSFIPMVRANRIQPTQIRCGVMVVSIGENDVNFGSEATMNKEQAVSLCKLALAKL